MYAYNATGFAERSVNITSTQGIYLTFDLTAPAISSVANTTENTTINISFETDDLANSTIEWGIVILNNTIANSTLAREHSASLTGLAANTTYFWNITACNNQGYCTEEGYSAQTDANPETIPPAITLLYPANSSLMSNDTTWTFINITTDENATCKHSTNSSFNYSSGTIFDSTGETAHSANYSVGQDNTYSLYYKCNDSLGNINTESLHHSFSVNETLDTQAPSITILVPANGSLLSNETTSVTLTISTDEAAICRYSASEAFLFAAGTLFSTTGGALHTASYTVSEGNSYNIYYKCNDSLANINTASEHHYFYVNATPPDEEGPLISGIGEESITGDSATIEWTTDEPATSRVKYGIASGLYTNSNYSGVLTASHSIELSSLEENTMYYYVVNSSDALGNPSES